jgi:hypothetical protein
VLSPVIRSALLANKIVAQIALQGVLQTESVGAVRAPGEEGARADCGDPQLGNPNVRLAARQPSALQFVLGIAGEFRLSIRLPS